METSRYIVGLQRTWEGGSQEARVYRKSLRSSGTNGRTMTSVQKAQVVTAGLVTRYRHRGLSEDSSSWLDDKVLARTAIH